MASSPADLPEFVRVRYGGGSRVVRRCACTFAGCDGRCPEGLYSESLGYCEWCANGRHLGEPRPKELEVNPRVA